MHKYMQSLFEHKDEIRDEIDAKFVHLLIHGNFGQTCLRLNIEVRENVYENGEKYAYGISTERE